MIECRDQAICKYMLSSRKLTTWIESTENNEIIEINNVEDR